MSDQACVDAEMIYESICMVCSASGLAVRCGRTHRHDERRDATARRTIMLRDTENDAAAFGVGCLVGLPSGQTEHQVGVRQMAVIAFITSDGM